MPIEFSCGQCQRTLRVPDDSAGREARCPQCGTISTVPSPAATAAEFDQPAAPPPAQPTQANPYASPHIQTPETTETARSTPTIIAPTIIDIGDVFSRSWQLFKDQMGLCISALLVYMAVQMGISFVNGIIGQLAAMTQGWAAAVVIQFILQVGIWLLNIWFSAGLALFALNVARGPGDLSDVFRGGPFFGRLVLANILVSLIVLGIMLVCCGLPAIIGAVVGQGMNGAVVGSVVGIAIAVVPLIVVSLVVSQFQYLIIDQNVDAAESLRVSYEVTNGNKLLLLILYFLSGLIVVAGALACLIGLLFAVPFVWLIFAVAYLTMTGQPTAANQDADSSY